MSLNCEPSELTPLRRSNQFQKLQKSLEELPQLQLQQHQQDQTSVTNQSDDFNEYMSINNNNHPVGSDSSRADTSEPNSQQAFNPKSFIMSDTRRVMTRITIDFVILLSGESSFFFLLYYSYNLTCFAGMDKYCQDEETFILEHPYTRLLYMLTFLVHINVIRFYLIILTREKIW